MPRPRRQDQSSLDPLTVRLTADEKADYRRAVESEGVSMSDDARAHIHARIKAAKKKTAPKAAKKKTAPKAAKKKTAPKAAKKKTAKK